MVSYFLDKGQFTGAKFHRNTAVYEKRDNDQNYAI